MIARKIRFSDARKIQRNGAKRSKFSKLEFFRDVDMPPITFNSFRLVPILLIIKEFRESSQNLSCAMMSICLQIPATVSVVALVIQLLPRTMEFLANTARLSV